MTASRSVPLADPALLSSTLVENAALMVSQGAPYGMCTNLKNQVNDDLLA